MEELARSNIEDEELGPKDIGGALGLAPPGVPVVRDGRDDHHDPVTGAGVTGKWFRPCRSRGRRDERRRPAPLCQAPCCPFQVLTSWKSGIVSPRSPSRRVSTEITSKVAILPRLTSL